MVIGLLCFNRSLTTKYVSMNNEPFNYYIFMVGLDKSSGSRNSVDDLSTIPDKIFETKWSNPIKVDRKRKVWYLFLRVF